MTGLQETVELTPGRNKTAVMAGMSKSLKNKTNRRNKPFLATGGITASPTSAFRPGRAGRYVIPCLTGDSQ
jgi:hypothetical protein